MKKDPLATSYARALLELAGERGELDPVLEEVEFLRRLLAENRDFRIFLLTPGVEPYQKRDVLDRVFQESMTATLLDFLQVVVVVKNRPHLLESILEEYCSLYDEKMGRVHVDAITAVPMSEERFEKFSRTLAGKLKKTIVLGNPVDPEILGGLVVRYGDWVVDGSVRTQLVALSERIGEHKPGSEFIHED